MYSPTIVCDRHSGLSTPLSLTKSSVTSSQVIPSSAADCVPFAYPRFHDDYLAGRALVIGCPKLDDNRAYAEKLGQILARSDVRGVTVIRMEVPCCGGISMAARQGLAASGKDLPFRDVVVGVDGAAGAALPDGDP